MARSRLPEKRLLALLPATREEVATALGVHPITAHKYLKALRERGLVQLTRIGRRAIYTVSAPNAST